MCKYDFAELCSHFSQSNVIKTFPKIVDKKKAEQCSNGMCFNLSIEWLRRMLVCGAKPCQALTEENVGSDLERLADDFCAYDDDCKNGTHERRERYDIYIRRGTKEKYKLACEYDPYNKEATYGSLKGGVNGPLDLIQNGEGMLCSFYFIGKSREQLGAHVIALYKNNDSKYYMFDPNYGTYLITTQGELNFFYERVAENYTDEIEKNKKLKPHCHYVFFEPLAKNDEEGCCLIG